MAKLATTALVVIRATWASLATRVGRVLAEFRATLGRWAPQVVWVWQAPKEPMVTRATWAVSGRRVLRVTSELRVPLATRAPMDLLGLLAREAPQAMLVSAEPLG